MDHGDHDGREDFLQRWSRLKEAARSAEPAPAPAPDSDPPVLPPVDKLTLESDYRGFFHPKVEEALRRAALKKLFSDPHFNVMDGLDVYIDDYSKSDPLPAAMLDQLEHAQKILRWAREKPESAAVLPPGESATPAVSSPAESASVEENSGRNEASDAAPPDPAS